MTLVIDIFVEQIGYGTGQVLLYLFTFGKRKPRWPNDRAGSVVTEELIFYGSTWLGYLFWVVVIGVVVYLSRG